MPANKKTFQDCIFLSGIVLLSFIPYIKGLGFYGIDWSFLGRLSMSGDQSLPGFFKVLYNDWVKMQPGKVLYLASLYKMFGLNPFGYHIFNNTIFLLNILLFYVVLCNFFNRRFLCLSAALVYALLPHYSSVRFWVQGFELNLALTFYFLSLYSDLRAMRAQPAGFWAWKLSSTLSLICSMLTHPIAMVLFLLNPILVWYHERKICESSFKNGVESSPNSLTQLRSTNPRVLFYINLSVLLPIINLKVLSAIESGNLNFDYILNNLLNASHGNYDWGLNYIHAIAVAYGSYGIGLPVIVWTTILNYSSLTILAVAGLLGLVIYLFFYSTMRESKHSYPDKTDLITFVKRGFVVFVLGYAAYLIDIGVRFSSTGAVNVTAIAAALGVALTMVGFLGWISTLFGSNRVKVQIYYVLIALLCIAGFVINNRIASFWIAAYKQEQMILDDIYKKFPTPLAGSALLLDGICPYVGPAMLFETNWDLTGALRTVYRDNTFRADIVTEKLKVKEDGVYIQHHDGVHTYPFKNLYIYNFEQKASFQLTNAQSAIDYFQTFNPNHNLSCPDGRPGFGLPVFKLNSFIFR